MHDKSGSPIPGCKVTATNKSMGLSNTSVSGRKSEFGFLSLLPAVYDLRAEVKGFVPQDKSNLVVLLNGMIKRDLTLVAEGA